MAKPQLEDGFSRIANKILEALAKADLSGRERRILDVIIRKTYGFHKKSDRISLSQFARLTGISRTHVCDMLAKLYAKHCIIVYKNTNPYSYEFNKNYEQWGQKQGVTENGNCYRKRKSGVTENGNQVLPKTVTTKDTLTKDIFTKDRGDTKKNVDNFSDKEKSDQNQPKPTSEEMSQIIAHSLNQSTYQDNSSPVKDEPEQKRKTGSAPLDRFNEFVAGNQDKIIAIVKTLWYWGPKSEAITRDSIDRMRAWILANPKKGNKKDWLRFMQTWLRDDIEKVKKDAYQFRPYMTAEQEADYYASKQRSRVGADDQHDFEPIGEIVNQES